MVSKKLVVGLVVVVAVVVGAGSIATYLIRISETPATMGHGKLMIDNPPALNQTATLTYVLEGGLSGVLPGEKIAILIGLGDGLIWADNVIQENRYIVENKYLRQIVTCPENLWVEVSGTIRAVKTGRWNIKAWATATTHWGSLENIPPDYEKNTPAPAGAAGVNINVTVTENSAYVENGWHVPPENDNIYQGIPLAPRNPVQTTLSFPDPPRLNHVADLVCKISSSIDVPNVSVELSLPDEFISVDENTLWRGDLYRNSSIELNVRVKAIEPDNGVIRAYVWSEASGARQLISVDQLYVSITEDNVLVSHTLPPPKSFGVGVRVSRCESLQSLNVPESSLAANNPALLGEIPSGQIVVTGSISYRESDGSYQPLRLAKVEIYDEELFGDELLGTDNTDNNGIFEFGPISNDDGPLQGTRDIYIVVVPMNSAANMFNLPSYRSETKYDVPDGLVDVENWGPPEDQEGGWRVFKYVTDAWDYVVNGPAGRPMRPINIGWPNPQTGFYYDSNGNCSIGIAQGHDFFPYVAQHEYGHFVMYEVYNWWMPPDSGGEHQAWGRYTPGLAWSEGWADFFPLAVQDDPWSNYLGIDFERDPTRGIRLDNERDCVEARVAGALWDIFDNAEDSYWWLPYHDQISLGFKPIWDVFVGAGYRADRFRNFWLHFKATYIDNYERLHFSKAALYQNTIYYNAEPTCIITPISGLQALPVTISAEATDPDPEDSGYLWIEFQYSPNNVTWYPVENDNSAPYSIRWDPDDYYPSFYVRARAWDGMENSGWDETGPFNVVPPPLTYSPTHPLPWEYYPDNNVRFEWVRPQANWEVAGYSYVFDNAPDTKPDNTIDTLENSIMFENVPEGIWYFHIRAISPLGARSMTAHFSVWIKQQPEAELPAITTAEGLQSSPAAAYGDNRFFVVWNDRNTLLRAKIYDLEGKRC